MATRHRPGMYSNPALMFRPIQMFQLPLKFAGCRSRKTSTVVGGFGGLAGGSDEREIGRLVRGDHALYQAVMMPARHGEPGGDAPDGRRRLHRWIRRHPCEEKRGAQRAPYRWVQRIALVRPVQVTFAASPLRATRTSAIGTSPSRLPDQSPVSSASCQTSAGDNEIRLKADECAMNQTFPRGGFNPAAKSSMTDGGQAIPCPAKRGAT